MSIGSRPERLNLSVTSGITGLSIVQVVRAAMPWLLVLLLFLMLVTYIPALSLALPNALFGA
ncbi:hypothetical protein [Tepidimonas charontis]|uniref:C4-dicarboxylate TRAP transporter large permease protein DctM n=1 Tax=Tepidimonas charontis TaxID=2267262 RepID=A0A554XAA7_9BURK|nr:hypothetical protein [Tepidimonas charontis]TSE32748.1 C4-dicarboxylate TRAP transporter large permease protein DctM [Tepidimonas charontis]